jgi:hypothetical protein
LKRKTEKLIQEMVEILEELEIYDRESWHTIHPTSYGLAQAMGWLLMIERELEAKRPAVTRRKSGRPVTFSLARCVGDAVRLDTDLISHLPAYQMIQRRNWKNRIIDLKNRLKRWVESVSVISDCPVPLPKKRRISLELDLTDDQVSAMEQIFAQLMGSRG